MKQVLVIEDNLDNPAKIQTRAGRIKTVVEQGAGIVKAMVRSTADAATLTAFLKSLGGTHLLVREELLIKSLVDNFSDETVRGVLEMLAKCLIKVYESNGYAVYVIR